MAGKKRHAHYQRRRDEGKREHLAELMKDLPDLELRWVPSRDGRAEAAQVVRYE